MKRYQEQYIFIALFSIRIFLAVRLVEHVAGFGVILLGPGDESYPGQSATTLQQRIWLLARKDR